MAKVVIGNAGGSRGGVHVWTKEGKVKGKRKPGAKRAKGIKIERARKLKETCIKPLSSAVVA